jgi:hypothetical protein
VPDPKGNVRTLLQKMELRVGILPEGAMMKLAHAPAEYQATVGGELTVPLSISRIAEFKEPLKIELVPDEKQMGLISAEPLSLTPAETKTALTIKLADNPQFVGERTFLIRATAYQQGKWLVKSETAVVVEVRAK